MRPARILPGQRSASLANLTAPTYERDFKFGYQWDQYPNNGKFYCDVPYVNNENPMIRSISWTTNPSKEQQEMINNGTLRSNDNVDSHTVVTSSNASFNSEDNLQCKVHYRAHHGAQIINTANLNLVPFGPDSVKILQTCQQIEHECALILYGENSYSFRIYESHRHELRADTPGFINSDGVKNGKLRHAIEMMFCWKCPQPQFFEYDPLIRFMRLIGPRNSSFLRDIKILGRFKTAVDPNRVLKFHAPSHTLEELLPVYTDIIGEVCTNIQKLTIHELLQVSHHPRFWKPTLDMSDEDRIDGIVKRVVEGLPKLQELQLGDYVTVPHQSEDVWGKSLRWMVFVNERRKTEIPQPNEQNGRNRSGLADYEAGVFASVRHRRKLDLHITVGARDFRDRSKIECKRRPISGIWRPWSMRVKQSTQG